MKNRLAKIAITLAPIAVALSVAYSTAFTQRGGKAEPNRIEFKRGAHSTTISDTVRGDEQAEYVFSAKKGQRLVIKLTSVPVRSSVFQLLGEDNDTLGLEYDANFDYSGVLPKTGDYFVNVRRPTEAKGTSRFKLTVVLSAVSRAAAQKDQDAVEREEYAVYSAMIEELYAKDGRRLIVISDPSCCGAAAAPKDYWRYPYQQSAPVSQAVYANFRERNAERVSLKRSFSLPTEYVFLEFEELKKFVPNPEEGFKNFYAKYPGSGGFITLSRVGFNRKRDVAFVYSNMVCGATCQEGRFIVLSKKSGVWRISSSVLHTVYVP